MTEGLSAWRIAAANPEVCRAIFGFDRVVVPVMGGLTPKMQPASRLPFLQEFIEGTNETNLPSMTSQMDEDLHSHTVTDKYEALAWLQSVGESREDDTNKAQHEKWQDEVSQAGLQLLNMYLQKQVAELVRDRWRKGGLSARHIQTIFNTARKNMIEFLRANVVDEQSATPLDVLGEGNEKSDQEASQAFLADHPCVWSVQLRRLIIDGDDAEKNTNFEVPFVHLGRTQSTFVLSLQHWPRQSQGPATLPTIQAKAAIFARKLLRVRDLIGADNDVVNRLCGRARGLCVSLGLDGTLFADEPTDTNRPYLKERAEKPFNDVELHEIATFRDGKWVLEEVDLAGEIASALDNVNHGLEERSDSPMRLFVDNLKIYGGMSDAEGAELYNDLRAFEKPFPLGCALSKLAHNIDLPPSKDTESTRFTTVRTDLRTQREVEAESRGYQWNDAPPSNGVSWDPVSLFAWLNSCVDSLQCQEARLAINTDSSEADVYANMPRPLLSFGGFEPSRIKSGALFGVYKEYRNKNWWDALSEDEKRSVSAWIKDSFP